jgi:hypothetical protein
MDTDAEVSLSTGAPPDGDVNQARATRAEAERARGGVMAQERAVAEREPSRPAPPEDPDRPVIHGVHAPVELM